VPDTVVSLHISGLDEPYEVEGALFDGHLTVQRTNAYVRRVQGHGSLAGAGGASATVTFDLRSLPAGYDERPTGEIRITDSAVGVDLTVSVELSEERGWPIEGVTYVEDQSRPCIERRLVGVVPGPTDTAATGTHRAVDASGRSVLVTWTVDDGGALPDTASLRELRRLGGPGLGADGNVMVWALAAFDGALFAATCNWRLESYRDWEKWAFSRGPIDTSEGAEIWRLQADDDDAPPTWERVVGAGLGDPFNHGIRNLATAGGRLFAVTANHTNGFEIWHTADGRHWAPAMTGGFGNRESTSGRGLCLFDGHLYVGTENKDTGAEIWRAPEHAAAEADAWERVLGDDPTRSWYADLTVFDGHLYAGSLMTHTSGQEAAAERNHPGCYLVRSADGVTWEDAVADSFGNPENLGILCMAVFDGHLYAGTTNGTGAEVFRSADGLAWELVHKAAGDPEREWHAWKLHAYGDRLYLGLGRLEHVWWSGFRLLSTDNGLDWSTDMEPTMTTHYGLRSMAEYRGRLYLGTASFPDCSQLIEARAKDR
jgi:hypothetical protein